MQNLIKGIAQDKQINEEEIIDHLAEILKIKFGVLIMEKERLLIDEVKTKIITRLYNSEKHTVKMDTGMQKLFKLDLLENDYLQPALEELIQEGVVAKLSQAYALTREGIMKFKEFYGEI